MAKREFKVIAGALRLRTARRGSVDGRCAGGGANAVSISEGVSLIDAIGKADAPFCVSDPIVVMIIALPNEP